MPYISNCPNTSVIFDIIQLAHPTSSFNVLLQRAAHNDKDACMIRNDVMLTA